MGLVTYSTIHLIVFDRLIQLVQVLLMAKFAGSCAGDAFYSLLLDDLRGRVCILSHED